MHPKYLGDSYDIVKRYFCEAFRTLGYAVYADLMYSGEWAGQDKVLYHFLGARPNSRVLEHPSALFVDPDTGVREKSGPAHVSLKAVANFSQEHEVVFAFDQSFSRGPSAAPRMQKKLAVLAALSCHGMYYDSHARFLFASKEAERLRQLSALLVSQGLPAARLVSPA